MSDKLTDWIANRLIERGWSIRELARRASISHSHAARIVNGEVTPSAEICTAIAKVFGESPEAVLRLAGILPTVTVDQAEIQSLLEQWRQLSYEDRLAAYHYLKSLNDTREERERLLQERRAGTINGVIPVNR